MTENEAIKHLKLCMKSRIFIPNNDVLGVAIKALEEIQQYRAIGTVEEFKALKEKATPKKPIIEYHCGLEIICPTCNCKVNDIEDKEWRCKCGQKLDWEGGE